MHLEQAVVSWWRGKATAGREEKFSDDVRGPVRVHCWSVYWDYWPSTSQTSLPAAGPVESSPGSSCPEFWTFLLEKRLKTVLKQNSVIVVLLTLRWRWRGGGGKEERGWGRDVVHQVTLSRLSSSGVKVSTWRSGILGGADGASLDPCRVCVLFWDVDVNFWMFETHWRAAPDGSDSWRNSQSRWQNWSQRTDPRSPGSRRCSAGTLISHTHTQTNTHTYTHTHTLTDTCTHINFVWWVS